MHMLMEKHGMSVFMQALESKLAACRNFAKDQAARKNYATENGNLFNSNATKFSHSLHTTYFDKT